MKKTYARKNHRKKNSSKVTNKKKSGGDFRQTLLMQGTIVSLFLLGFIMMNTISPEDSQNFRKKLLTAVSSENFLGSISYLVGNNSSTADIDNAYYVDSSSDGDFRIDYDTLRQIGATNEKK